MMNSPKQTLLPNQQKQYEPIGIPKNIPKIKLIKKSYLN